MSQPEGLPAVVIVGRPNVGKSTLFNCLTRTRRSIVGDEPGITRDRIHGFAEHDGKRFELIDTGGIIPDDREMIPTQILKQARYALEQAAHIIYLIDGRTEITGSDRDLGRMLKKIGKPVTLVVNKIDTTKSDPLVHGFHDLGFDDVFGVSAEHRIGLNELLDHVTGSFPTSAEESADAAATKKIKIAIIGRPNVGKSTLLNSLVGADRAIVSPVAGTTRDAVDETVKKGNVEFVFVDTAGIRRKGKTHEMAEKLSVVMARRNIRMAHVVLLILDSIEGPLGLDATIAGYAHEEGRALVICVNKWDAAGKKMKDFELEVRDEFKFLEYAPVVFISALTGNGVQRLYDMIVRAYDESSKRITTGELNRFAQTIDIDKPNVKIKYMTQASIRPPTFVIFTDKKKALHFSIERQIANRLRKQFGFEYTPLVVKTKAKSS